ncbi:amidohydrolase, partial [bacterium]|nr:amidohydrolase [bacterium]
MEKKNNQRLLALSFVLSTMLIIMTACGTMNPVVNEETQPAQTTSLAEETLPEQEATMVLKNGAIYTMDANNTVASAIAVLNDQIIYVGDDAGVEKYIGNGTQVIDLAGEMVSPGFIDGHTHEVGNLIKKDTSVYLNETKPDLELYKEALKRFIEEHPTEEVIYGTGMDLNAFPDSIPTNGWIDEIVTDKPVIFSDMSGHGNLINSKALEMAGITSETTAPAGGTIYKDANGELTGYLSDSGSLLEVFPIIEYTPQMYREAFLKFQKEMNSYGITGIAIAGPTIDPSQAWAVFNEMEKNGELSLRINCVTWTFGDSAFGKELAETAIKVLDEGQKYNSDFQHVSMVKGIIDGVPEGKTAFLLEPYAPGAEMDADYRGPQFATQDEMNEFVATIDKAGYQVQIHAMGDAGVNTTLNAFEYAQTQNGVRDSRHAIAHVTLITDADKVRMGKLKVIGAMQPLWWYYDPFFSPLEEQMFGTERFDSEYHIKDMVDAGIVITGSIDYPVLLDARPLNGIEAGATQSSPYPGEEDDPTYVRNADQAVSVLEMLKIYTTN